MELWQLMSWLQFGHHVVNFFHMVGVLVSIRQPTEHGSEYIALEKELRVPEYAYKEGNGTPLQYSCLENPWTEEPGGLQSMGSLRVGHN